MTLIRTAAGSALDGAGRAQVRGARGSLRRVRFTAGRAATPVARIADRLSELETVWRARARRPAGADEGELTLASLDAEGLLSAAVALGELRDEIDSLTVAMAGEFAAASVDDQTGPMLLAGHRSSAGRLAELWRVPYASARRWSEVGQATRTRRSLHGVPQEAEYPNVAAAISIDRPRRGAGERMPLSVDQAAEIVRELRKVSPACARESVVAGEQVVVSYAPALTVEQTRRLAIEVRDRIDEDGIEPREVRRRRRRSLTISTTRDGLTHVDWYLDPESAGWVVSAIDAQVGAELRGPALRGPDLPEARTLAQLRSDAATEAFRHRGACDRGGIDSPAVSMVIRVGLDELRSGVGTASIDGVGTAVSISTARRLAADADIIPAVLGARSEVLDLGRRRRLFTTAQKLALAERDGGCAWAACPHPPAYTEAHHIRWWERDAGPTDISNGVLLCSHHHHRVHADGWLIEVRENVPWFIPPPHVDPTKTPRKGGRLRLRR